MRKKDILLKIAVSFGDTRRVLQKMKERGISLSRNKEKFSYFNPDNNTIAISKHKGRKNRARVGLLHEFGHSIAYSKSNNKEKYYPENISPERKIKLERQANKNALNFITDNPSKKDYIEKSKEDYGTYKKNAKVNNFDRQYDQSVKKYKKLLKKGKLGDIGTINPKFLKKLDISEKDYSDAPDTYKYGLIGAQDHAIKDNEYKNSFGPALKKKHYVT